MRFPEGIFGRNLEILWGERRRKKEEEKAREEDENLKKTMGKKGQTQRSKVSFFPLILSLIFLQNFGTDLE